MNVSKVISKLKQLYPGKKIVLNIPEFPLEIVCELDQVKQTEAIAVIDFARPHYHKKNTEVYEVIEGELIVYLQGDIKRLKKGDRITIPPMAVHCTVGNETWIRVHANPGWSLEDHILVKNV